VYKKKKNEDENILNDKEENGKIFPIPVLLASLKNGRDSI
jgi:hypothetical protein